MVGVFGNPQFADTTFGASSPNFSNYTMGNVVVCLGDPSSHGGIVSSTAGNTTVFCKGLLVARNGSIHDCPIPGHGNTAITATVTNKYVNGQLVLIYGNMAACGAVIQPNRFRKVLTN